MERKKTTWTKEQETICLNIIKNRGSKSLTQCFEEASAELYGLHSAKAISLRWYYSWSNPKSNHYKGICFTVVGTKNSVSNRTRKHKNSTVFSEKKHSLSIWKRFLKLLKLN